MLTVNIVPSKCKQWGTRLALTKDEIKCLYERLHVRYQTSEKTYVNIENGEVCERKCRLIKILTAGNTLQEECDVN